ncbi:MAG: patatin-like phospholipase family protein [Myxococcota bacterium]
MTPSASDEDRNEPPLQPGAGRRAVVLTGGGARGAYEIGVLTFLFRDLPRELGRLPRLDVYAGTSVGAVHACALAATADDPEEGITRLLRVWHNMSFSGVYRFALRDALSFSRTLIGFIRGTPIDPSSYPDRIHGFLNTEPLEQLVVQSIPWRKLRRNIRTGVVSALCVSTTEIATGRTVVFVDTPERRVPSWTRDAQVVARAALIGPTHALASAAIPVLFPAVRIGRSYYCDGGLRMHGPLSPALRLGADRILIIGLSRKGHEEGDGPLEQGRLRQFRSAGFLFGKILDALLMDRIEHDLDHMRLLNEILRAGTEAFGDDFVSRINVVARRERGLGFRVVEDCFIRPSEDIGAIAGRHVSRIRGEASGSWIGNLAFRTLTRGAPEEEADLMSYLLFDGEYARELIELGRADAGRHVEELVRFFSEDPDAKMAASS